MSSWKCNQCGYVQHHSERHGAPSMCGSCMTVDELVEVIGCDNCENVFDPDGEDCQVGGDRSQGEGWPDRAVPSLCPTCYGKAVRGE